jgi:transposase
MERHALRDDQFARIEHLLPGRPGTVGRNSDLGNRLFVDAVIWKFRVGRPWRDLPERFGGWCNTHKRFSRWAVSGVWETRGLLIRRRIADDDDLAFFTTWCPAATSIETLAAVEGHRWAIEDSFETAKNELGLDHNESRSWHGWYSGRFAAGDPRSDATPWVIASTPERKCPDRVAGHHCTEIGATLSSAG